MSKVSLASTVAGWECLCMLADRSHSYLCDVQIVLRESVRSRVQSSRYHISSGPCLLWQSHAPSHLEQKCEQSATSWAVFALACW